MVEGSRDAVIYQLLKRGAGVSEISRETGISRNTVRKIARDQFPDLYWANHSEFEVEIEKGEDPDETIKYYEEMGRKYLGKRRENPTKGRGNWVLIFSRGK